MDSRVTLAVAIHDFVNERSRSITAAPGKAQGTNTFPNDIRVNELSGEFFTNLPVIDLSRCRFRAPSLRIPPIE
jgi:hypothetical protein